MHLITKPPVQVPVLLLFLLALFVASFSLLLMTLGCLLAALGAPGGIGIGGAYLLPLTPGMNIGAVCTYRFPKARSQLCKSLDQIVDAFVQQVFVLDQLMQETAEGGGTGYACCACDATGYSQVRVAPRLRISSATVGMR
jgi:hypothetical protein